MIPSRAQKTVLFVKYSIYYSITKNSFIWACMAEEPTTHRGAQAETGTHGGSEDAHEEADAVDVGRGVDVSLRAGDVNDGIWDALAICCKELFKLQKPGGQRNYDRG